MLLHRSKVFVLGRTRPLKPVSSNSDQVQPLLWQNVYRRIRKVLPDGILSIKAQCARFRAGINGKCEVEAKLLQTCHPQDLGGGCELMHEALLIGQTWKSKTTSSQCKYYHEKLA